MFLPNFYSISIENAPQPPTYDYKKVFIGSMFTGSVCSQVRIVKDSGIMTVSATSKCNALLPHTYNVPV
jgi:hypothetical protein